MNGRASMWKIRAFSKETAVHSRQLNCHSDMKHFFHPQTNLIMSNVQFSWRLYSKHTFKLVQIPTVVHTCFKENAYFKDN